MITVIADNPSMGATYRMPEALSPLTIDGKVRTIVRQLDGWREWHADFILDVQTGDEAGPQTETSPPSPTLWEACRQQIERSAWLLVMGKSGLAVLEDLYGPGQFTSAPFPPVVMYHVESFYRGDVATACNKAAETIGAVKTFAMPDLWAGGQCPAGTIPLLQPMIVPPQPPFKPSSVTIVHTPGTDKKAIAKGSDLIKRGVDAARRSLPTEQIVYKDVRLTSHADTLARKASAHICIDQVPPPEVVARGLGNSGCEGLALACFTIADYQVDTSALFDNPPVHVATNSGEVADAIVWYAKQGITMRERTRRRSWSWAMQNLSYHEWRRYFHRHLSSGHLPETMRADLVAPAPF